MNRKISCRTAFVYILCIICMCQTVFIARLVNMETEYNRKVLDIQKTCYDYEQEIIELYDRLERD